MSDNINQNFNLTEEEQAQYNENDNYVYEICQLFDKDGDESIYMADLIDLIKALGIGLNGKNQNVISDFIEKNKNSEKIKFEDFFNLYDTLNENKKNKKEEEEELIKAFQFFDLERTGFIDADYFKKAITSFGNKISEQDYNNIMNQAIYDKTNKNFDYKDLTQLILGIKN